MPTNEHKTCQQPWEVDGAVSASVCALIERPDEESARESKETPFTRSMNVIFGTNSSGKLFRSVLSLDSLKFDLDFQWNEFHVSSREK